jgi:hypothetical protein
MQEEGISERSVGMAALDRTVYSFSIHRSNMEIANLLLPLMALSARGDQVETAFGYPPHFLILRLNLHDFNPRRTLCTAPS